MSEIRGAIPGSTSADDRMRLALDVLPVAVSWCRLGDGRVEFVNRAFTRMFGLALADCRDVFDVVSRTFADPGAAERHLAQAIKDISSPHERRVDIPEEELLCRRQDGAQFHAAFSVSLIPEAGMCLAVFVDITERKKRERTLLTLAERDPLTGLKNRRSIEDALSAAVHDTFGLLVLDLDGFKQINDNFGHSVGDDVLKEFARRLSRHFRESDVVGRLGGDEFAVLLLPAMSTQDADRMIKRLYDALNEPFLLGEATVQVAFSAGYAVHPHDASSLIELFRVADARMYEAKRDRRLAAARGAPTPFGAP